MGLCCLELQLSSSISWDCCSCMVSNCGETDLKDGERSFEPDLLPLCGFLLDRSLELDCLWFDFLDDAPVDEDISLIISSMSASSMPVLALMLSWNFT